MAREVSGLGLAAAGAGAVFIYGGLTGRSPLKVVQQVIRGSAPTSAPTVALAADSGGSTGGGGGPAGGGSVVGGGGDVHTIFHKTAAQFGWGSGAQWQALNAMEMQEAGYQPTVKNPSSGALGIAQALNHGTAHTAGTLGNEYGGYLTDAQNRAANSGDAAAQSLWMMRYIRSRYGDPVTAWAGYWTRGGWY